MGGPRITRPPGPSIAASNTTYNTGTIVLSGGANITVGTNGQTITISGGAGGGGGAFTAGMSNAGNTSGTTGVADRRLVFAGGNNVTLSQSLDAANSSGTITISVPNTSSQTGTQFSAGISGGNTAGNTGTKPGMMVLAGGNNITVSGSTNGDTITVTISGGAGAGGFAGGGISGGNTSGDTGSVTGRLIFAGNNNITLSGSTNAGSMTISVSGPNTAAQTGTQFSAGLSNIGNTAGDTGTVAGRLVLAGGNGVTLSGSTNGVSETVTVSAQTNSVSSATTASSVTSDNVVGANAGRYALEGHQHAGVGPAGLTNIGNTAGDTGAKHGRLILAGGNNVTLSGSSSNNNAQTITISAAAQTGTQYSAGISNLGNTAGDTGVKAARLVLVGTDNITLSGSTNGESATVSIKGAAGGAGGNFSAGVSTDGNTAGATGITGTRLVLVGEDAVTLSQTTDANGGTVSVFAGPVLGATERIPVGLQAGSSNNSLPNATMTIAPINIPGYLTAHTFAPIMRATGTSASTGGLSWWVGVYTKVNSTQISLATSGSRTSSWQSNTNNSSNWGGVSGVRRWPIEQTFNFTPGDYLVGWMIRTTNAGTYSMMGAFQNTIRASGVLGAATASSLPAYPWNGIYSASITSIPNSIAASDLAASYPGDNNWMADFIFHNSTYGP